MGMSCLYDISPSFRFPLEIFVGTLNVNLMKKTEWRELINLTVSYIKMYIHHTINTAKFYVYFTNK